MSLDAKRSLVEGGHPDFSVAHQCALLNLNRSTLYYESAGEDAENLELMGLIDECFTAHSMYGSPKITRWLRERGRMVNHKRVERLMRVMGLRATVPCPSLSVGHKEHRKWPYLLGGLSIERPNQVWSSDITYVRMRRGFLYLVAVMDWRSRFILGWQLSDTLEPDFCVDALGQALRLGNPEIFNTDQGSQFTSLAFTGELENHQIRISMDGRGRCFDNIFTERLWRTVKYEEVYVKDYGSPREARENLGQYFGFYNNERYHQALDYRTPAQVHFGK